MFRQRWNITFLTCIRWILAINLTLLVVGIIRLSVRHQLDTTDGGSQAAVGCSTARQNATARARNSSAHVPNIVHYIWYTTEPRPLQWHHMLCVFSAHKILKPSAIYFHTNMEPTGTYWERVLKLPTVKVNKREPPTELFGEKIKEPVYYTSHSNVDRVKILMEYGGIYLDLDVLVLRPFDYLRHHYECTIGLEVETKVCGSVVVCSSHSMFLVLWINAYLDDYRIDEWAYNTGTVPFNLARRFPHLVHVDHDRINRPNFDELELIWSPSLRFNWQRNYAVHLYYRLWKDQSPFFHGLEPNDISIKTWNSSFGEMARFVLYGSPQLLPTDGF